jgi:hypothetical protein
MTNGLSGTKGRAARALVISGGEKPPNRPVAPLNDA